MKDQIIGKTIIRRADCFCSSMDWAKKQLENVCDGTVFLADRYRKLRGRQGRIWKWYPGQLVVTCLLKPKGRLLHEVDMNHSLTSLNMALTVGVVEVLGRYGVGLKWPNDFVVSDKKVGGILFESVLYGKMIKGIIAGIAINCNNKFSQHNQFYDSATSLKNITNEPIDIDNLQNEMILSMDFWYKQWYEGSADGSAGIFSYWKKYQAYIGKKISVHKMDGSIVSGIVKDVVPSGNLLLITDDLETVEIAK